MFWQARIKVAVNLHRSSVSYANNLDLFYYCHNNNCISLTVRKNVVSKNSSYSFWRGSSKHAQLYDPKRNDHDILNNKKYERVKCVYCQCKIPAQYLESGTVTRLHVVWMSPCVNLVHKSYVSDADDNIPLKIITRYWLKHFFLYRFRTTGCFSEC